MAEIRLFRAVTSAGTGKFGEEARLWLAALLVSILLNGVLLAWMSYESIRSEITRQLAMPTVPEETIVTLFPEMFEVEPLVEKPESEKPKSVRTSDDQATVEAPKSRRYIGERNTQATSDRNSTDEDSEMPSQAGREARPEEQPETTESVYQDGRLEVPEQSALPNQPATSAQPSPLTPAPEMVKGTTTPDPGEDEFSQSAIREKLLEGPNSIEQSVAKAEVKENIKPREERKTREGETDGLALKKPKEDPKPKAKPTNSAANDPAFRGNQSKTAIRGSISRTGRSALDVVDTPMGRYHSQISRAVELEWQRNCVRRRDYIVPGYLTVRFFVDAEGRVTTLELLGDIEGGEIQKGFTLDSIRDAEIPAMPANLKKEMAGDSLELIFNFYF